MGKKPPEKDPAVEALTAQAASNSDRISDLEARVARIEQAFGSALGITVQAASPSPR